MNLLDKLAQRCYIIGMIKIDKEIETMKNGTVRKFDYGTVNYEGKTYKMNQDAYPENYGTDGEIRYYATAIGPDGAEYNITWETTKGWDKANAEAKRVEELLAEQKLGYLNEAEETELATLLDSPNTSWLDDESNACDWDRPIDVQRIWEIEE